YLFSNTLAPAIVGASIAVFNLLDRDDRPRQQVMANTARFREGMEQAGFNILRGTHPIVPVMIGDAKQATALADAMLAEGIYVVGFSYPVVPKGEARVRVQLSAAHRTADVDRALAAFQKVGKSLGLI
ncbi:MAG: aminotransferase class I/II-fold pyridoxal phosphate-dependent enzyme, partial [Candidatus Omnitrophota bacterium]